MLILQDIKRNLHGRFNNFIAGDIIVEFFLFHSKLIAQVFEWLQQQFIQLGQASFREQGCCHANGLGMPVKKLEDWMFGDLFQSFLDFEKVAELFFVYASWNRLEEKTVGLLLVQFVKFVQLL